MLCYEVLFPPHSFQIPVGMGEERGERLGLAIGGERLGQEWACGLRF